MNGQADFLKRLAGKFWLMACCFGCLRMGVEYGR